MIKIQGDTPMYRSLAILALVGCAVPVDVDAPDHDAQGYDHADTPALAAPCVEHDDCAAGQACMVLKNPDASICVEVEAGYVTTPCTSDRQCLDGTTCHPCYGVCAVTW